MPLRLIMMLLLFGRNIVLSVPLFFALGMALARTSGPRRSWNSTGIADDIKEEDSVADLIAWLPPMLDLILVLPLSKTGLLS